MREAITAALAHEPRTSSDVTTTVARRLGCSRQAVEQAARQMRRERLLAIVPGEYGTATWALVAPTTRALPPGRSNTDVPWHQDWEAGLRAVAAWEPYLVESDDEPEEWRDRWER